MYQMEIIVQEAEGMPYLMMHTTHPFIHQNRQTDEDAHAFVRAESIRRWEACRCHPSDSMSQMTGSFGMDVKFIPNSAQHSEYDTGHVSDAAALLVRGVVMTIEKSPVSIHVGFFV
ncbi:hypothetical protein PVOR_11189 [Paenibacillus vortex V453]|uniref:Uncharacterized protein n=2 Tax=Paenibacillus TaxID=44249 RepID=A0A2R9SXG9_9BACL|nr:hypothetical protein PVOR_11189 [Paenibacillus vortex V453]